MHARVSTYQGPPDLTQDRVEEVDRYDRENILPPLRQMDGFKGVIALLDRQSGKAVSVTLWESEQAMRASEEGANQLLVAFYALQASHPEDGSPAHLSVEIGCEEHHVHAINEGRERLTRAMRMFL